MRVSAVWAVRVRPTWAAGAVTRGTVPIQMRAAEVAEKKPTSQIPRDVPLTWLSVRSLMDYCMGLGRWRYAHHHRAATLQDLPLVDSFETQSNVQATLDARGIPMERFIQWYNACTRRTWRECAVILESLGAGCIPPFVLQRALHRISSVSDAASAVRLVQLHLSGYSVSEAHRLCLLLLSTCIRRHRAWHIARPLTACILDTVQRWLTKREKQRYMYSQALLVSAWTAFLDGMPDPRVCDAMEQLWCAAHERVPGAAHAMEAYVCEKSASSRFTASKLPVALVRHWLATCSHAHRTPFLHLAIRVAAAHNDAEHVRMWYKELGSGAGRHAELPAATESLRGIDTEQDSRTTTSFLRALAMSSSQTDLHDAWALFDAISGSSIANAKLPGAKVPDWILMLRAAAGDARIPAQRVSALLRLYEGRATVASEKELHNVAWRVPPDIQARLESSVAAHTALMEGFMERGDLARAWAVWDAMICRGIAPDMWALMTLCRLYMDAGHPARALEVVMQWCHEGVRLTRQRGPMLMQVPTLSSLPHVNLRVQMQQKKESRPARTARHAWREIAQTRSIQHDDGSSNNASGPQEAKQVHSNAHVVRLRPTTYLANTLLAGLYRARAFETLMLVWQALGPTLHVRPDVASVDLMLRAATAEARSALTRAHSMWAPAARAYFRRILLTQHPELHACKNPLEAPGKRAWIVRSELQLRRWERWIDQRVRALWRGASFSSASSSRPEQAPHNEDVPMTLSETLSSPYICYDARVFHQYCELLITLLEAPMQLASCPDLCEELFLVAAWMRALDIVPLHETLCLWCSAHDELLPPAASTAAWRAWLAAWLGEDRVPTDAQLGHWYRVHRAAKQHAAAFTPAP